MHFISRLRLELVIYIEFGDPLQISFNWSNKFDKFKCLLTQIVFLFPNENFHQNFIHLFILIELFYLLGN